MQGLERGLMEQRTELLRPAEMADMLRMKESTIRSWILKRRIPFVRLGRRVFIRRSDIDELIAKNVIMPRAKHTVQVHQVRMPGQEVGHDQDT